MRYKKCYVNSPVYTVNQSVYMFALSARCNHVGSGFKFYTNMNMKVEAGGEGKVGKSRDHHVTKPTTVGSQYWSITAYLFRIPGR